jgi:hypothetical protein
MDKYAKAVVGAIVAALTALGALLSGGEGLGDITAGQWVGVAVAFVSALGVVWAVPNAPDGPEDASGTFTTSSYNP